MNLRITETGATMKRETTERIALEDLHFFHQLARSLTSSFDLDTILRTILEHMERMVDAELWTLLMLDERSNDLYYAIAAGGEQENLRDLRVKVGEGVGGWVVQHGETLIVPESVEDPRLRDSGAKPSSVRSVIALPLLGRKGTHGAIEIFNPRAEQMTDYTIAFLHILADDTTGLYNVRHLYDILGRELERSAKTSSPLSLAFLDLDRFKLVNDVNGHLVGSQLLALAGQRLQELCRKQDWCFRYGGDEFVVLMPSTDADCAYTLTAAMLQTLHNTDFRMKNGLILRIGASVGLSTSPADGKTLHAIIGVADSRMYKVKNQGRGQVRGA
jgi:diguanylate cyclase (GGDEF)-like protein